MGRKESSEESAGIQGKGPILKEEQAQGPQNGEWKMKAERYVLIA